MISLPAINKPAVQRQCSPNSCTGMRKVRDVQHSRPDDVLRVPTPQNGATTFAEFAKRRKIMSGLSQMCTLMATAGPSLTSRERSEIGVTLLWQLMRPGLLIPSADDVSLSKHTIVEDIDNKVKEKIDIKAKVEEPFPEQQHGLASSSSGQPWWSQTPCFVIEESPPE